MESKKITEWKVLFSLEKNTDKLEAGEILIIPSEDQWNDFKHKIKALIYLKTNNDLFSFESFLAFVPETTSEVEIGLRSRLQEYIQKTNSVKELIPVENFEAFFTMLPTIGEYRKLVKTVTPEIANSVLKSVSDLVFWEGQQQKTDDWLIKGKKSLAFREAFMRNSESYFAYHSAGEILKGLDFESFDIISKNLDLKFQLDSFSNPHQIKFTFSQDSVLPKRINIMIGKNGLGKSQALSKIVSALVGRTDHLNILRDPNGKTGRPLINRLIAIGTPGEVYNTFPRLNVKRPRIKYKLLNMIRNSKSINAATGESFQQLLRSEDVIGNQFRYNIFYNSVSNCLPVEDIVIPIEQYDGLPPFYPLSGFLKRNIGEQRRLLLLGAISEKAEPKIFRDGTLYPLSSGQLSFFKVALLACLHIENGSLLLLDEPETHLHPNLISDFISLLNTLLRATGSYSIIATHSAYFVREISREQVHVFKEMPDRGISIVNPRLKTYGANIGDISHFVFDDNIDDKLTNNILENIRDKKGNIDFDLDTLKSELSTEVLMSLKREISG
ncbi:AAA family ATPase [Halobacteriovorax sp.]|uniref:AAA family ATPase n=1 Tax=Halobacteriovorax sp. TaxID=2020862 RepID=UPI003AF2F6FC